jgi:hypothetical protein
VHAQTQITATGFEQLLCTVSGCQRLTNARSDATPGKQRNIELQADAGVVVTVLGIGNIFTLAA